MENPRDRRAALAPVVAMVLLVAAALIAWCLAYHPKPPPQAFICTVTPMRGGGLVTACEPSAGRP